MEFVPPDFDTNDKEIYKANKAAVVTGPIACAKIVTHEGREFYLLPETMEVQLGREAKSELNYFQIGDSNTISKLHARIYWDDKEHCFKI